MVLVFEAMGRDLRAHLDLEPAAQQLPAIKVRAETCQRAHGQRRLQASCACGQPGVRGATAVGARQGRLTREAHAAQQTVAGARQAWVRRC